MRRYCLRVKSCIMLIAISVVLLVQRHFANSISIETVLYEKLKNVVIMGFAAQFRHGLNYSWLQIQSLVMHQQSFSCQSLNLA